jgi:hypothetical protein
MGIAAAAILTGIFNRTAQYYIVKYNYNETRRLPISDGEPEDGCEAKLIECHSQFSMAYADEHPTVMLIDNRKAVC